MGCYGIGVNRILAATIEQHHDLKGIKWPEGIAPYAVEIITVNHSDEKVRAAAEKIYEELTRAGKDVLFDDRDERAGVKFNDADLIGIPTQIIIGERSLKEGKVEVKRRQTGETKLIPVDSIISNL
jgi:prolyl-tRNA synthetase